jgi:hypothetical protein
VHTRGYTVWLIEWGWDGDHAKPEWPSIEAILSPWIGASRVVRLVDQLYAQRIYTIRERLQYALHPENNPYPARFSEGWMGYIYCGDNPFLTGRKVRQFRTPPDGRPKWTEYPKPSSVLSQLAELRQRR